MLTPAQQKLACSIRANDLKAFRSNKGGSGAPNKAIWHRLLRKYTDVPPDTITLILNSWIASGEIERIKESSVRQRKGSHGISPHPNATQNSVSSVNAPSQTSNTANPVPTGGKTSTAKPVPPGAKTSPAKPNMVERAIQTEVSGPQNGTGTGQDEQAEIRHLSEQTIRECYKIEEMLRAVQLNAAGHDMKEEMVSDSAPDEGPSLEEQLCLLTDSNSSTNEDEAEYVSDFIDAKNAVLFPPSVLATSLNAPPQYSLLGRNISSIVGTNDPRVLINTNQPWSVFICGLQGSGKSYSMGCLLESCLIPNRILGPLQRPLTGLVLHYGQYTSSTSFYPSEAAFLAVPNPDFSSMQSKVNVTVYVSPSNYHGLSATYSQIPGVTVRKLLLQPHQLDISSMLNLMAIDQKENTTLYMAQVTKVLRDMAMETGGFDFFDFKSRIKGLNLFSAQRKALDQRIGLLESFLDVDTQSRGSLFDFTPGALNIVDLSCPFVDSGMACILFDICLSTFLQTQTANCKGKVIALDEAHKYITNSHASKILTETLLGVIRQQRHFGARVIISTQEPTIDPRLIDLSSMTLVHRFTSPEWYQTLKRHISIANAESDSEDNRELFEKIVRLNTGEGYIFAPSALVDRLDGVERLGGGLMKIKIRKRTTWDGGKSVLAV